MRTYHIIQLFNNLPIKLPYPIMFFIAPRHKQFANNIVRLAWEYMSMLSERLLLFVPEESLNNIINGRT